MRTMAGFDLIPFAMSLFAHCTTDSRTHMIRPMDIYNTNCQWPYIDQSLLNLPSLVRSDTAEHNSHRLNSTFEKLLTFIGFWFCCLYIRNVYGKPYSKTLNGEVLDYVSSFEKKEPKYLWEIFKPAFFWEINTEIAKGDLEPLLIELHTAKIISENLKWLFLDETILGVDIGWRLLLLRRISPVKLELFPYGEERGRTFGPNKSCLSLHRLKFATYQNPDSKNNIYKRWYIPLFKVGYPYICPWQLLFALSCFINLHICFPSKNNLETFTHKL